MLHFDSLNQNAYGKLHKEIYQANWIVGVNALPKRIDRTILLRGKHDKDNGQNPSALTLSSAGTRAMPGVAYVQAGELKEHGKGINDWCWHITREEGTERQQ